MSLFLRRIAHFAAQKVAADPRARQTAANVARAVIDQAKQITREEDKARAAGQAVRRALKKLQGGR